jgi:putative ATP-binding cassette transporter
MWSRWLSVTKPFFLSERRFQAFGLLGLLVAFVLCLVGLNAVNTFVNCALMTSIEQRQLAAFLTLAVLYAGVFVTSTIMAVFKTFTEESLGLRWRDWLTRHLLGKYLSRKAYYRLNGRSDIDNPDQRISEDVKSFTTTSLSFFLIVLQSTVALASFSGILWSITPWLTLAAVVYAILGSGVTVLLGKKLMKLDVVQLKREADLRYDLIHVRSNAEPIALLRGEADEERRLGVRLTKVLDNFRKIVGLNRNIGFFTVGFTYFIQLIPLLIVAPMYIRGEVEFGKVMQAGLAFTTVMDAFSLIVKEFKTVSAFGAVIERLGTAWEAIDEETGPQKKAALEVVEQEGALTFDRLTLLTPRGERLLIKDLSLELPQGERLLIVGPNGSGRTSLFRAIAGVWSSGRGRILRPPLEQCLFLPEKPYLVPGTLRDQVLYGTHRTDVSEEHILEVLNQVGLASVLERVGGLDSERDWKSLLSLGQQQVLAFARLLVAEPAFAFLDEATSALDSTTGQSLYEILSRTSITYVSVGNDPALVDYHDSILELSPDGDWKVVSRRPELLSA